MQPNEHLDVMLGEIVDLYYMHALDVQKVKCGRNYRRVLDA
jgi:hypothetical protein